VAHHEPARRVSQHGDLGLEAERVVLQHREGQGDDDGARGVRLALRVEHSNAGVAPRRLACRGLQPDVRRHLALEVHDERRVAVQDAARRRSAVRRISLLASDRSLISAWIRGGEPCTNASASSRSRRARAAGTGIEERLKRAVGLSLLAHEGEDAPIRLQIGPCGVSSPSSERRAHPSPAPWRVVPRRAVASSRARRRG
jgi:hypothetical protein